MDFETVPAWTGRIDFPSETPEKVVSAAGRRALAVVDRQMAASLQKVTVALARMDRRIGTSWITPFIWSYELSQYILCQKQLLRNGIMLQYEYVRRHMNV
ncbi:hypothetical protein [Sporosarcina sp. ACRSL]|uniref:hypothetical protein n=1 Tax=Sporosarcina sp. ACRSL TaxID=2918215 RepID=UPI001EF69EE3|nr:hypothetical protein [Sporosarcina sp. ACRSL]